MNIDATFWVAVSFFIFVGLLVYLKIPQKIINILNENIKNIKDQIYGAEQLKEEAKKILSNHEKKISNSKNEIKNMIDKANDDTEKNILKINSEFHTIVENKKKNNEQRIRQMKEEAFKDIKNTSVKITIDSVKRLLKNSIDKNKLEKLYLSSIDEAKNALKKNSS